MQKKSNNCNQTDISKKDAIRMIKGIIVTAIFIAVVLFTILFVNSKESSVAVNATQSESLVNDIEKVAINNIIDQKTKPIIINNTENKNEVDLKKVEPIKEKKKTVYVTAQSGLNIRKEPNVLSDKVGAYPFEQEIQTTDQTDDWLMTDLGYINEQYTSPDKPNTDFTTFSSSRKKDRELVSLGTFKLTAYCACKKCCGNTHGITMSGTHVTEGRTIAVDPKVIPLGAHVVIDGHEYIAEDTGSAVKGNIIDMYLGTHQRALDFGVQHKEVFVYK